MYTSKYIHVYVHVNIKCRGGSRTRPVYMHVCGHVAISGWVQDPRNPGGCKTRPYDLVKLKHYTNQGQTRAPCLPLLFISRCEASSLPSECACAENGGVSVLQLRKQQLGLALINLQGVLIHILLDRFHDVVTGLSQTAEEHDSLGA